LRPVTVLITADSPHALVGRDASVQVGSPGTGVRPKSTTVGGELHRARFASVHSFVPLVHGLCDQAQQPRLRSSATAPAPQMRQKTETNATATASATTKRTPQRAWSTAVEVGFEPTEDLRLHTLSRRAPSATRRLHRG